MFFAVIESDFLIRSSPRPMLTFAIILLLPSSLTLVTLLIHRLRSSRAAQRDRAPEETVKSLPSRVWTSTGLEKERPGDQNKFLKPLQTIDLEQGVDSLATGGDSSRSRPVQSEQRAWHQSQVECAICLSDFVEGDIVRVLPCCHIFHLDEVDMWLIQRKKLCPICKADVTQPFQKAAPRTVPEVTESVADAETPAASEQTPLLQRS